MCVRACGCARAVVHVHESDSPEAGEGRPESSTIDVLGAHEAKAAATALPSRLGKSRLRARGWEELKGARTILPSNLTSCESSRTQPRQEPNSAAGAAAATTPSLEEKSALSPDRSAPCPTPPSIANPLERPIFFVEPLRPRIRRLSRYPPEEGEGIVHEDRACTCAVSCPS